MSEDAIGGMLPSFDRHSYHAGVIMALAEVVGAGCKMLALSSALEHEFAREMIKVAEYGAEKRNVLLHVEDDLLVTRLFPPDVAKDKTVIMLLQSQTVLDEYLALKKLKEESNSQGNPDGIEMEIAQRFGELLSYDEASIARLLSEQR